MKEIKLYREDNGQYSTNEAQQDDISGWYVQKADYDQLKRENEELRAAISCLVFAMTKDIHKTGDNFRLQEALDKTLPQHLADIKADAVIEAANTLCITGSSVKTVRYDKYIEYAEELREGR